MSSEEWVLSILALNACTIALAFGLWEIAGEIKKLREFLERDLQ